MGISAMLSKWNVTFTKFTTNAHHTGSAVDIYVEYNLNGSATHI